MNIKKCAPLVVLLCILSCFGVAFWGHAKWLSFQPDYDITLVQDGTDSDRRQAKKTPIQSFLQKPSPIPEAKPMAKCQVPLEDVKIFAALCLDVPQSQLQVAEKEEWERELKKGKNGPWLFVISCKEKRYVVKVSFKIPGEYEASRKVQRFVPLTDDGTYTDGNMTLVVPVRFAIYDTVQRQLVRFINLMRDATVEVDEYANDRFLLVEFLPMVQDTMLGDLFSNSASCSLEQIYQIGYAIGRAIARLHKIGYTGRSRSWTVHGDMHPGQVFIAPDGRITIIDLDRIGLGDIVNDLGRILGNLIGALNGHTNPNMGPGRIIAYLFGFLAGYHTVLPQALDLNNDARFIELFSTDLVANGAVLLAVLLTYFTPLRGLPSRVIALSTMDLWRVMLTDISQEKKVAKLRRMRASKDYHDMLEQLAILRTPLETGDVPIEDSVCDPRGLIQQTASRITFSSQLAP